MNITELRQQVQSLRDEGFGEVYVADSPAGLVYSPHSHDYASVHWIIEGEMTFTAEGKTAVYTAGQRIDTPANVTHAVTIGPEGCLYIVAEDHELVY